MCEARSTNTLFFALLLLLKTDGVCEPLANVVAQPFSLSPLETSSPQYVCAILHTLMIIIAAFDDLIGLMTLVLHVSIDPSVTVSIDVYFSVSVDISVECYCHQL